MCVNEEVKYTPEWAKQYVSDEELIMQDAEALRVAGDELAEKAKQASQFVAKYVNDNESVIGKRALVNLWNAIAQWEEATSDETCPRCGGTVGHRVNCPDGIAFSDV